MPNQLKDLYKQIKEQKINHKDAIKEIIEFKILHNLQTEGLKISSTIEENKIAPAIAQDLLREKAVNYFKKLLSSVINLPTSRIEADVPLEAYGIDSVMVIQLTNQLRKDVRFAIENVIF